MLKRIASAILSAAIAAGMIAVPLPASAAVEPKAAINIHSSSSKGDDVLKFGDFEYINAGGITITGYTGNSTWVTIPKDINGVSVIAIGDCAFKDNSKINVVSIQASLKAIYDDAFSGCTNLQTINFPSSLKEIGSYTFYGCTALSEVTIPASVNEIGKNAFYGCTSLRKVSLPNSLTSLEDNIFYNCTNLKNINFPNALTNIGDNAFYNCKSLESAQLPDSVSYIGARAFTKCSNISNLHIPTSLKEISRESFSGCSGITSVSIPDSVKSIYYAAFRNCSKMESINIPESVTFIGDNTFRNCSSLKSIVIPDSVKKINTATFYGCTGLKSVTLSTKITSIGSAAFYNCSDISTVALPPSISAIEDNTFYGCKSLKSVTIPKAVKKIGFAAYANCINVKSVNFSGTAIAEIDAAAFSNCANLISVNIPGSVTKISERTFLGCSNLQEVTLPTTVTEIGDSAFSDCPLLKKIAIPSSVTKIGKEAFYDCTYLSNANLPKTLKELGDYAFACTNLNKVEIPNTMTKIGNYVFANCPNLKEATIPKSITEIGISAFDSTGIEKIEIPDSLTKISDFAFNNCKSLTSVNIPNSITDIGNFAFNGCKNLNEITIPDSITSIGDGALAGMGISEIILPTSVEKIGKNVFEGCGKLSDIYYIGSSNQWGAIDIGTPNDKLNSVNLYYDYRTLSNTSKVSKKSVSRGNSITITGSATGGIAPYTYKYYYKSQSDTEWTPISPEKDGNSAIFKKETIQKYDIKVVADDSKGKSDTTIIPVEITVPTLVNQISIKNKEKPNDNVEEKGIDFNDSIEITCQGAGGEGPYKYTYSYKADYSSWKTIENETDKTYIIFKPNETDIPYDNCSSFNYRFKVTIFDSKNRKADKNYTIQVNIPALENEVTVPEKITAGDTVEITNNTTGGVGSYNYKYTLSHKTDNWNFLISDWDYNPVESIPKSENSKCTFTINEPGEYRISVEVSDQHGHFKTVEKNITVDLKPLTNISTVPEKIFVEEKLYITGAAEGGEAPYRYSYFYKKSSVSNWNKILKDTDFTTASVKLGTKTTYDIMVVVKDKTGKEETKIMQVDVVEPEFTNKSSVTEEITLGEDVVITGSAEHGTEPYTYSYFYKESAAEDWTTISADTSETAASFKPESAAAYDVKVIVKDSKGEEKEKLFTVNVKTLPLENTSTVPAEITFGKLITINASAEGGTAPYTYQYFYKKEKAPSWNIKTADPAKTTVSFRPGEAVNYIVKVIVTDANGVQAIKEFNVAVSNAVTPFKNYVTYSPEITLGEAITIECTASDGTQPYTFSYYFKNSSSEDWTKSITNVADTTVSYQPEESGTINVLVTAKDGAGNTTEDTFNITVKAADVNTSDLKNESTVNSETINLGDTITINGAAQGGTGSYKYSYYYKKHSVNNWNEKLVDTENTSTSFKPGSAVTYDVKIVVTDSVGNTAEKIISVNVNK